MRYAIMDRSVLMTKDGHIVECANLYGNNGS